MSVILFAKESVFQDLADSYEGLKSLLRPHHGGPEEDQTFYGALRRLHFANVAAYLCQYHDETPLPEAELNALDPFVEIQGRALPYSSAVVSLHTFLRAWGSLKYNLTTNAGERFEPVQAYEYMERLSERFTEAVIDGLVQKLS